MIVKLIPRICACSRQFDDLQNLLNIAHASNIDVTQTEKLQSDLSQISATAEKIALVCHVAAITPEEKKVRKFQVYRGNHQPTEKVSTELSNLDGLIENLLNVRAIQENPELAAHLKIAIPRINEVISNWKKQISAFNQNPTNEAARSTAANSLHKARDVVIKFNTKVQPYENKDQRAKNALNHPGHNPNNHGK